MTDKVVPDDLAVVSMRGPEEWEEWLAGNGATSPGVWIRIAKKGSGQPSITFGEALDACLCYGWIDSQRRRLDESFSLQRYTPRGRRSIWSKINREKALALIEAGRMKPAGFAAIEAARSDGRWDAAYDSPRTATVPPDFASELAKRPHAAEFFQSLNSANRYAVLFRIHTARKPETREKRIASLVEMLERGEKLHP